MTEHRGALSCLKVEMIILKAILMIVILVGMVMLLLSVRALGRPAQTTLKDDTDSMMRDIEDVETPITPLSVFHTFLARDPKR